MVTPRLALRFREITPDVDPIREHEQILEAEGAVWWGWWKKYFEPDHQKLFAKLAKEGAGEALIIDRETQRCFSAKYIRAAGAGDPGVDDKRVPPYYRSEIGNIAGWLLLKKIKKVAYRPDIAERFDQSTLLPLDAPPPATKRPSKARAARGKSSAGGSGSKKVETIPMERPGILHLSDLHFGTDYSFLTQGERANIGDQRRTLTHCLKEDLRRAGLLNSIGLILVTGDFVTGKDSWPTVAREQILKEFKALRETLGLSKEHVVAVPGNHDSERYKAEENGDPNALAAEPQTRARHESEYRLFLEELTGRSAVKPLHYYLVYRHADFDLVVAALNSCTITASWSRAPTSCPPDRKSTRLNSSHANISYAVFCLKKKHTRLEYEIWMLEVQFERTLGHHRPPLALLSDESPVRERQILPQLHRRHALREHPTAIHN